MSISNYNYLENFPYPDKDNYDWKIIQIKKKPNGENTTIFLGELKNNENNENMKNSLILVKKIDIKEYSKNEEALKHILIDFNILYAFKNQNYFPNNITTLFSNDEQCLYLINNENIINLKQLLNANNKFHYLDNNKLNKWIIYQITYGLNILHSNNIIHHDIKLSNIYINENGKISISEFSSAILKGDESFEYTLFYAPPEILIDNIKNDEKIDMWLLGIIIIELYTCKCPFFQKGDTKDRKEQLKNILSYFDIDNNISEEKLKKELNENNNIPFKIDKIKSYIRDNDAIYLINNLLILNPKKRFTAEQVLSSNYLKEFSGIDSLIINKIQFPIDFKEIKGNKIELKKFIELMKKITQI